MRRAAGDAAADLTAVVPGRPLKVGVLVDLALTPEAGGHVKCWQRLAEAAVEYPDRLDLTVHFSGSSRAGSSCRRGALCAAAAGVQHRAAGPRGAGPYRPGALASPARGGARRLRHHPYDRRVFLLCAHRDAFRPPPRGPGGQLDPHQHPRIRPHHDGKAVGAPAWARPCVSRGKRCAGGAAPGQPPPRTPYRQAPRRGDLGDGQLWRRAR